jgi:hypothetical protein
MSARVLPDVVRTCCSLRLVISGTCSAALSLTMVANLIKQPTVFAVCHGASVCMCCCSVCQSVPHNVRWLHVGIERACCLPAYMPGVSSRQDSHSSLRLPVRLHNITHIRQATNTLSRHHTSYLPSTMGAHEGGKSAGPSLHPFVFPASPSLSRHAAASASLSASGMLSPSTEYVTSSAQGTAALHAASCGLHARTSTWLPVCGHSSRTVCK